jgi:hypothetical protein
MRELLENKIIKLIENYLKIIRNLENYGKYGITLEY